MRNPKTQKEGAHERHDSKPSERQMVWAPSGLELEALKTLLGMGARLGGDAAVKGAGSTLAALQSEGPMPYRIEASWSEDGQFCIAIRFVNATSHGAYVEKIATTQPRDIGFEVAAPKRSRSGGFGESDGGKLPWKKVDVGVPFYIPPEESVLILVRLLDDQDKTLSRSKTVEFSYEFSIIGGKDAQKRLKGDARAALRSSGPKPSWN